MSEFNLWQTLSKGMGNRWEAQRHEDKYTEGIPDVSYARGGRHGWIELKYLQKMPKPENLLAIRHFTEEQRNWLDRFGSRGGRCWLLLQIGQEATKREYLLFSHLVTRHVGLMTYVESVQMSTDHWKGQIDFNQLACHL